MKGPHIEEPSSIGRGGNEEGLLVKKVCARARKTVVNRLYLEPLSNQFDTPR